MLKFYNAIENIQLELTKKYEKHILITHNFEKNSISIELLNKEVENNRSLVNDILNDCINLLADKGYIYKKGFMGDNPFQISKGFPGEPVINSTTKNYYSLDFVSINN